LQPPADAPTVMRPGRCAYGSPSRRVLGRTRNYIKAVDGISRHHPCGHTVGIVGESGSGKTTLGLALLRLLRSEGRIQFAGHDVQRLSSSALRPLRREMQIVFQDPYGSLSPRLSVGVQIIGEGLPGASIGTDCERTPRHDHESCARSVSTPTSRIAIRTSSPAASASASPLPAPWCLRPRLVVLDEPTSALDMSVQAQIVDLLRELQARHQLAYLFISHDLRVVRALSSEVIVMRAGRVVEHGPTAEIFDHPKDPYTRSLMAAALDLEAIE